MWGYPGAISLPRCHPTGAIPQVLFKEITEHMPAKIFVFFVTADCQGIVKRRGAESAEEVLPKELCVLCDSAFQTSTRILNSHTEPRSQEQKALARSFTRGTPFGISSATHSAQSNGHKNGTANCLARSPMSFLRDVLSDLSNRGLKICFESLLC